MAHCGVCKILLNGNQILCKGCYSGWNKGLSLYEYTKQPYKPDPVMYPRGHSTTQDDWI